MAWITGFDCDAVVTPSALVKTKAAGFSFAGRYLKNMTSAEVKLICGAGLKIVSLFERKNTYGYFTAAQGAADGKRAVAQAFALGQPPGTPIIFAVDWDASAGQLAGGIAAYFKAVGAELVGRFAPGVYGSGLTLDTLKHAGLAYHQYLAQSTGWRDTRGFTGADIIQGRTTNEYGFGFPIDTATAMSEDYGGWTLPGAAT